MKKIYILRIVLLLCKSIPLRPAEVMVQNVSGGFEFIALSYIVPMVKINSFEVGQTQKKVKLRL